MGNIQGIKKAAKPPIKPARKIDHREPDVFFASCAVGVGLLALSFSFPDSAGISVNSKPSASMLSPFCSIGVNWRFSISVEIPAAQYLPEERPV